jgi:hypothetical protein
MNNHSIDIVEFGLENTETNNTIPKDKKDIENKNIIASIDKELNWSKTDIEYIKPKYIKLIDNSTTLLKMAKQKEKIDSTLQILVVIFGIISSFIMNISGIDDMAKTYLISIFTLGITLIGGINSIKKFGQNSGKYYSAYQEYKELITYINNIFVTLKADHTYEQLNNQINKKESKYEIMLPKSSIREIGTIEKQVEDEYTRAIASINNRYKLIDEENRLSEELTKKELYRNIIKKKSYIFLQEIRLKLYREYVVKTKISNNGDPISILDLSSYENYFRTNKVKTYNQIVYRYKAYIDQQLATYIISKTDNGDINYDYGQIERELINDLLLRYETNLFYNIINNKVKDYEKEIIEAEYTEEHINSKKVFIFSDDIVS